MEMLNEWERLDYVNDSLRLIQNKNGLTFGTDAYLLAAFVKSSKGSFGAEIGSGTGIVSMLCASREKLKKIYAIEVQSEFAELTGRNAKLNSLDDKISVICSDVRDVRARDVGGELDVIFANPPYMRTDSGKRNAYDEKFIARHEVCGGIDDFCAAAARLLKFGGLFYCVYRPDRMMDLLAALRACKLEPKYIVPVSADSETAPSMILVEAKKGAAPSLKLSKTLYLHSAEEWCGKSRELTSEAKQIYDTCSFEHFRKAEK